MNDFCVMRYELFFKPSVAKKIAEDTTDNEPTYKVTARLTKSGAFDYGNRTTAVIEIENLPKRFDPIRAFDTRYDNRVTKDFDKWVTTYFWEHFKGNLERVEDISSTLNLKYFRTPYDSKQKKEISYGEAMHIMLGTWKDNKYTRAMLTTVNRIKCMFSTIEVEDHTDESHPKVLMPGLLNMLPLGMEYEEE